VERGQRHAALEEGVHAEANVDQLDTTENVSVMINQFTRNKTGSEFHGALEEDVHAKTNVDELDTTKNVNVRFLLLTSLHETKQEAREQGGRSTPRSKRVSTPRPQSTI